MALFLLLLYLTVGAFSLHGDRVLVLMDSESYRTTHSSFFNILKDSGFSVDFKMSDANDIIIEKYKEYLYDHVIILAPLTEEFGGLMNSKILTKFIDAGGNVILALGNNNGQAIREFAADCGFVVELVNKPVNTEESIQLKKENLVNINLLSGDVSSVTYAGGSVHFKSNNALIIPIAAINLDDREPTTYTYVIAALQAKNNARVTVLGSSELFSNSLMSDSNDNKRLANNLINWTFQKIGRLRISNVSHHLVNESEQKSFYTIRQHMYFEIKIEQYLNNKWVNFCVDGMQLEFIRVDPFVRQNLKCKDGIHSVEFQIPDVHGIYKFHIDYVQPGYSRIRHSSLIPIRPLKHDQYDRFIPSALPYYIACLSMAISPFVLSIALFYHKDAVEKQKQN